MKYMIITFVLCLSVALTAQPRQQNLDDLIFGTNSEQDTLSNDSNDLLRNDIITVNYEKKSARTAMLFSLILPGAGQFYADKSAFQTYIYPIIELGLIGGMIYFNKRGDDKTRDYEYYANGETITQQIGDYTYTGVRYQRVFQHNVETILQAHNSNDIYDGTFFRLDNTNTQHFYEDIGKYDKYVFGWADWYHTFATNDQGVFVLGTAGYEDAFVMSSDDYSARWLSNHTIANIEAGNFDDPIPYNSNTSSMMRRTYISMRKDAEKEYSMTHNLSFLLVANHIVSAIEAVSLTNKVNRLSISQSPLKLHYYADLSNNRITPTITLSFKF